MKKLRSRAEQAGMYLEFMIGLPKYWVTFPDRNGKYLARTMRMVDANAKKQELPRIDHLNKPAQLRLEEENVKQCLFNAGEQLGL